LLISWLSDSAALQGTKPFRTDRSRGGTTGILVDAIGVVKKANPAGYGNKCVRPPAATSIHHATPGHLRTGLAASVGRWTSLNKIDKNEAYPTTLDLC